MGISIGIFLFAGFNHWRIGYEQLLWGIFAGWFIGAVIYLKLAAKEADTKFDQGPKDEKEDEVRNDTDEGMKDR